MNSFHYKALNYTGYMAKDGILFEGDTEYGHYQVVDTIYSGRRARVLYSGDHLAAQSGVAHDGLNDLLFDYNQRFIELVRALLPKRILLIGGGAFTLPKAVVDEFPDVLLDIVEMDGELLGIAQKYFDFKPGKHTNVHTGDGRRYLEATGAIYDVILVDAFTHDTIPPSLQTIEAARSLSRHLSNNGVIAMNIITAYNGRRSAVLHRQIAALQMAFSHIEIFPASHSLSLWMPQNLVLIGQNNLHDPQQYLRYAALDLPEVNIDSAINDADTTQGNTYVTP